MVARMGCDLLAWVLFHAPFLHPPWDSDRKDAAGVRANIPISHSMVKGDVSSAAVGGHRVSAPGRLL